MSSDQNENAQLFRKAREALSEGENFRAYDIAEKISDDGGSPSPEKIRIMSLALARSGSLKRARELAARLPLSDDSEIAGLKSRLFKDMALVTANPDEKRNLFAQAAQASHVGFSRQKNWYNGINAASCRFMAGDRDKARRLVREEVLPLCLSTTEKDLWLDATVGECHLLLGDYQAAAENYSKAVAATTAAGHFGSLSSILRQLHMLVSEIGDAAVPVLNSLSLPEIAVFSGHMIDRPDRPHPRFPLSAEEGVRQALRTIIAKRTIRLAFASCACGGDILFLEEVLSAGGECTIVPPLPLPKTIQNSVAFAPGDWGMRLKAVLGHPKVRLLTPECDETGEDDAIVYDFANRYLLGLAVLKSRHVGNLPLVGVCVWDGKESGLLGGTDSAVRLWKKQGIPVEVVKPEVQA